MYRDFLIDYIKGVALLDSVLTVVFQKEFSAPLDPCKYPLMTKTSRFRAKDALMLLVEYGMRYVCVGKT